MSSILNYLARNRVTNSHKVLETFGGWASASNQGELSSRFPFLSVQPVTAVCWRCLPNSLISGWFTFLGAVYIDLLRVKQNFHLSLLFWQSHSSGRNHASYVAKISSLSCETECFFPLFLMENRGVKVQFLSPQVGANSTYLFSFGLIFSQQYSTEQLYPRYCAHQLRRVSRLFWRQKCYSRAKYQKYRILNLHISFLLGRIQDAHSGR